ncbi:MAG: fibronectin type III domain-containing protein, partial [Planctomycetia bacterium]
MGVDGSSSPLLQGGWAAGSVAAELGSLPANAVYATLVPDRDAAFSLGLTYKESPEAQGVRIVTANLLAKNEVLYITKPRSSARIDQRAAPRGRDAAGAPLKIDTIQAQVLPGGVIRVEPGTTGEVSIVLTNAAMNRAGILSADSIRLQRLETVLPNLQSVDLRGNPLGNGAFGEGDRAGVIDTATATLSGRSAVAVAFSQNMKSPVLAPAAATSRFASAGNPFNIVLDSRLLSEPDGDSVYVTAYSSTPDVRVSINGRTVTIHPAMYASSKSSSREYFKGSATVTISASDRISPFGNAGRLAVKSFDVNIGTYGVSDELASPGAERNPAGFAEGLDVSATTGGITYRTVTDENGRFQIRGIAESPRTSEQVNNSTLTLSIADAQPKTIRSGWAGVVPDDSWEKTTLPAEDGSLVQLIRVWNSALQRYDIQLTVIGADGTEATPTVLNVNSLPVRYDTIAKATPLAINNGQLYFSLSGETISDGRITARPVTVVRVDVKNPAALDVFFNSANPGAASGIPFSLFFKGSNAYLLSGEAGSPSFLQRIDVLTKARGTALRFSVQPYDPATSLLVGSEGTQIVVFERHGEFWVNDIVRKWRLAEDGNSYIRDQAFVSPPRVWPYWMAYGDDGGLYLSHTPAQDPRNQFLGEIHKYDSRTGTLLWSRATLADGLALAPTEVDEVITDSLFFNPSGGVIVAGTLSGRLPGQENAFGPHDPNDPNWLYGKTDAFVASLGSDGQLLWYRQVGTKEEEWAAYAFASNTGQITVQTRSYVNGDLFGFRTTFATVVSGLGLQSPTKTANIAASDSTSTGASGGRAITVNEGDTVVFGMLPAPTGLTSELLPGAVKLSWTASPPTTAPAVTDYIIEWSTDSVTWTRVDDGTSKDKTATVTGLPGGAALTFRVSAANRDGISPAATISVTTPAAVPAVVTNLTASVPAGDAGDRTVRLSWNAPASNGGSDITGYVIRKSTDGGLTWTAAMTVPFGQTTADVTGLANGVAVILDVAAQNVEGIGPRAVSNAAVPRAAATVGAPRNLVAALATTPGSVALTWDPPATGIAPSGYLVEYKRVADATWTAFNAATTTNGAGTVAATVSGLAASTAYQFRVTAATIAGLSPNAAVSLSVTTPVTVVPGVPTAVRVMPGTMSGEMWVSWNAPTFTGETPTDYAVEYSSNWTASSGGTWTVAADGVSSNTWARVVGLTNATSYVFRVAAINTAGKGPASQYSAAVAPIAQGVELVTVGDAGNQADANGYGSVPHEYRIGKYEITIGQYVEFLNAVASSDPYGLYDPLMGSESTIMGISRSGAPGSYTYSVIGPVGVTGGQSGPHRPITCVSWFDAARFANWMHNGKGSGSTETGAYSLNGAISGTPPAKSPLAIFYIPSENEWYKAAYYKGGSPDAGYWKYATRSNEAPGNKIGNQTNQANYKAAGIFTVTQSSQFFGNQNLLTDVGAFTNSGSFYGTFDQTGNVNEWNDLSGAGAPRGNRGGAYFNVASDLSSDSRNGSVAPSGGSPGIGFRLASSLVISPLVDAGRLPAPLDVSATISGAAATLRWRAPEASATIARLGYLVQQSIDGGRTWTASGTAASTATTLPISGLTPGVPYSFRIAATSAGGTGAFSEPTPLQFATATPAVPAAPTIGTASNAGVGGVTVAWTKPANTGNLQITDYFIEASTDNGATWTSVADVAAPNELVTITGLAHGTYVFRVRAANELGLGVSSAASAPFMFAAAIPALSAMGNVTAGDGQATVNWTVVNDGGSTITSFAIQQSQNGGSTWQTATLANVLTGSSRSATVTALTNGFAYTFRVSANNAVGTSGFSPSSVPVTPLVPQTSPVNWDLDGDGVYNPSSGGVANPKATYVVDSTSSDLPAPAGLTAVPAPGGVVLTWSQPIAAGKPGVIDYVVEWSVDGNSWTRFDDGTSTSTTATVTGLSSGQSYRFRVAAANVNGISMRRSTVTAVTGATSPASVSGLVATIDGQTATLHWNRPAGDGGSPITGYAIRRSNDAGATWVDAQTVAADSLTVDVAGLASGIAVIFDVAATNASGTGSRVVSNAVVPVSAPVVGTPQSLVATLAPASGSVTLTWDPPATGLTPTGYLVEYKRVADANWTAFNTTTTTTGSGSVTATVSGLAGSTAYQFRVTAVTAGALGPNAAVSNSMTTPAAVVPGVPTGLQVMPGTLSGEIWVSWAAPSVTGGTITDYVIEYSSNWTSTTGVTWTTANDGVSTSTTASITGLTNTASYVFRVAAKNATGTGNSSERSPAVSPNGPNSDTFVEFVHVGNPGNAGQTLTYSGTPMTFGAVDEAYRIGKYEFTNAQYARFLNAVDPDGTNPQGIWNSSLGSDARGGITNTGTTNGSRYAVKPNMGDKPVNYVSWFDAARVANWLHHGARAYSTTDASANAPQNTGAYTLGALTSGTAQAKNAGALFSIPTENQWYKAAYYNPTLSNGAGGYRVYGNGFDTQPTAVTASATGVGSAGGAGNFANYNLGADWNSQDGNVTTVGTNGGPSYYGAFDMSGNVHEWNDLSGAAVSSRGLRGVGWYSTFASSLSSSGRGSTGPWDESSAVGFRLGSSLAPLSLISSSLPLAPSAVTVAVTGTTATLRWQPPEAATTISHLEYVLERSSDGGHTWIAFGMAAADATVRAISGLEPGLPYSFRIAATSATGTGAFSDPTQPQVATAAPAVPGAPTIGTASSAGDGRVTLTWTKPTDTGNLPITDYLLEASADKGATWTPIVEGASSNESASIPDLTPGTYVFRVRAANVMGLGAWSASSAPLTLTATLLAVPAIGSIAAGDAQATVRWTSGSGVAAITSFTIEQSSDGGQTWQIATLTESLSGSSMSATAVGLANGAAYTFRVRAIGSDNASVVSDPSVPVTPRLATQSTAGTAGSGGLVEVAAGIKVGTATSTVTIFVNPVAPSLTASPSLPAGVTAIEGLPTAVALGAFTGPDGDGTSPDGTEWTVEVRWWKGDARPTAAARTFTAPRGTLPTQTITFPTKGTYTVEVTVTDNDGQTAVKTVDVTVAGGTPAAVIGRIAAGTFEPLADLVTISESDALLLEGRLSKEGFERVASTHYEWIARKAGSTAIFRTGSARAFTLTPDDGGSYEVSFRGRDEHGTWTDWATRTITVAHVAPQAAILGVPPSGTAVPQGSPITLEAAVIAMKRGDSVEESGISWRVAGPNGFVKTHTGKLFSFTPSRPGSYQVTLEAQDDDFAASQAKGSATATITVANVVPVIPGDGITVTLPVGVAAAIEGKAITFKARAFDAQTTLAGGDTLTYTWTKVTRNGVDYPLPEGTVTAGDTLTFTPDDDGVYAATVTVTDGHTAAADRPTATAAVTVANAAPTGALRGRVVGAMADGTTVAQGGQIDFRIVHGSDTAGGLDASTNDMTAG